MNLKDKYPEISKEFDIEKNGFLPEELKPVSGKRVWWKCNFNHSWQTSVANRTRQNTGCPYCNSKLATGDNNLKFLYPEISKEWDYSINKKSPEEYLSKSNKNVSWICKYGHVWNSKISTRVLYNTRCPFCFKNESYNENFIYYVLSEIFNVEKLKNPEIDIYIKDLNVGIEYDGYYHKFRYESDCRKNLWASDNLKLLIRVRENYLPKLPSIDNVIIIDQVGSNLDSCKRSIYKIFEILNIDKKLINFNISFETKTRNYNLSKELINSWSPNNKIDIKTSLKTHKYLWICDKCGSEYSTELKNRMNKNCCPYCSSQKVNKTNSISTTHGYLLKYLSPMNDVNPDDVTYGTSNKLRFLLNSKEYYTTPRNFNRYINPPFQQ